MMIFAFVVIVLAITVVLASIFSPPDVEYKTAIIRDFGEGYTVVQIKDIEPPEDTRNGMFQIVTTQNEVFRVHSSNVLLVGEVKISKNSKLHSNHYSATNPTQK